MEQCASWASVNPKETFVKLSQTQMERESFDDWLTEVWALWWAATMEKADSSRPPSPTSAPTLAPATLAPPLSAVSAIPTRSLRRCARVKCLLRSVAPVPVSILECCSSLGLWRYQDPKTPSGVGGRTNTRRPRRRRSSMAVLLRRRQGWQRKPRRRRRPSESEGTRCADKAKRWCSSVRQTNIGL